MGYGIKIVESQIRCVYCNCLMEEETRDHVPSKCLFPKGTPGLVTVPSCKECNKGFAKDEEYFRQMVTFALESSDHPQAKEPTDKALRNFEREESEKFRKIFWRP